MVSFPVVPFDYFVSVAFAGLEVWSVLGWKASGVTSRKGPGFLSFSGYEMGVFYGWWGFSRASKIMLGCIVCSSFRWLFLENSAYM